MMEFGKLPFRRRYLVGLGFLVVGAAGLVGTAEQGFGSYADGQAAAHAADKRDTAQAAWFRQRQTERPTQCLVDAGTGLLSLAAGSYLMRGGWRRLMRVDGEWAYDMPPRAPDAAPQLPPVANRPEQLAIAVPPVVHQEASPVLTALTVLFSKT